MKKHLRQFCAYAVSLGIKDVRIEQRGRHPHLVGTKPDGRLIRYALPCKPSDWRSEAKREADLRRMLRPPTLGANVGARSVAVRTARVLSSITTSKEGSHMKALLLAVLVTVGFVGAAMACPAGTHPVCSYYGGKSVCTCVR